MLRDMSDTLAFVEVVERGSFTAAAESFRTSKARISKKVQDLEQRLGVKLLHRTTRNIRLTEAGSIYFDRCRDLARLIGDAESAVEQVHGKPTKRPQGGVHANHGRGHFGSLFPHFRGCP